MFLLNVKDGTPEGSISKSRAFEMKDPLRTVIGIIAGVEIYVFGIVTVSFVAVAVAGVSIILFQ